MTLKTDTFSVYMAYIRLLHFFKSKDISGRKQNVLSRNIFSLFGTLRGH